MKNLFSNANYIVIAAILTCGSLSTAQNATATESKIISVPREKVIQALTQIKKDPGIAPWAERDSKSSSWNKDLVFIEFKNERGEWQQQESQPYLHAFESSSTKFPFKKLLDSVFVKFDFRELSLFLPHLESNDPYPTIILSTIMGIGYKVDRFADTLNVKVNLTFNKAPGTNSYTLTDVKPVGYNDSKRIFGETYISFRPYAFRSVFWFSDTNEKLSVDEATPYLISETVPLILKVFFNQDSHLSKINDFINEKMQ